MKKLYSPFLLRTAFIVLLMLTFVRGWGQYSYTTLGSTYTQDFNNLSATAAPSAAVTGGSFNNVNAALNGWYFLEAGSSTDTKYTASNGSVNGGDTYSFGAASNSERALGGLQSGSVIPSFGFYLTNNTGSTVRNIQITYTGEQWRLGATGRLDQLDFQYSTNATSLSTGTWSDFNALDFTAPISTGTIGTVDGNLNANKVLITSTITGLSIANGAKVFIRWNDLNAAGADDGLAIDDISITVLPNNFTVTYDGNTSTGGTAPTDAFSPYAPNSTVTVLDNTGNLVKTGSTFNNWNTAANGSGTPYSAGNTFTINQNTILYAQWISNTPILNHTGTNTTNHGSTCLNVAATKQTYTVTNTGGATATGVTIASNNTEFAVSNISATTIASGGSITYDVTFTPTVVGTRNATITVNNTENITVSNTLTGTGVAPVTATPTTNAATAITTNTATLNASAVFGVCPSTTGKGFVIARTVDNSTPTIGGTGVSNRTVTLGSAGTYTFAETGLYPNTSYTYRAYLTDGTTPIYGAPVEFTTLTPPVNDLCSDAVELVVNDPDVNGTLANATSSPSPFSGTSKDVWYKFTPNCDGKFTIDLTGTAGRVNIWLYNACGTLSSLYNTATNGNVKFLTAGTTAAPLLNGTTYYVRIVADNAAGEASFKIRVNNLIAIVTQPVDTTVNAGTTAQFSVSSPANQTGRQWQVLTTAGGAVWTDIPSATGSPYTTPSTTMAMNGYKYRVIISNGTCQTITSNEALLTVSPATISTDMFRSKVSGDWDDVGTWISSSDGGTTWLNPATAKPTGSASSIEIMDTHTVKTSVSEGAKDLTVHSGGTLDLNASLINAGIFKIEDTGTVNIKYYSSNLSTNLWAGTEDFAPNSLVRVTLMGSGANLFTVSAGVPAITARTYNAYTALFGFLELLPASGWSAFLPNLADYNLTHNDLTLTYSTASNFNMISGNTTTMGIGRDFITNIGAPISNSVAFQTGAGSSTLNIRGNYVKKGTGVFTFSGSSATGTNLTYNVEGDYKIENGTTRILSAFAGGVNFTFNLKGNLEITAGGLFNGNTNATSYASSSFNFTGTNQTINYAGNTKPSYIYFYAKNGSNVQLINQDFALDTNSKFIVESGATLDFGFNGTTALNLLTGTGNGQKFELKDGGTLKITSPVGISNGTGVYTGNVQIGATSANRIFGTAGIYHYIGKENQVSGNGLPSTAGDKKVIVELANDDLKFWATPESGVGSVKRFTSGGGLEIRKGIVYDGQNPDVPAEDHGRFADAVDTGASLAQSGNLTMTGGRYILYHSAVAAPHLSGNYNLTGGVIQFDGNDQSIRAPKNYLTVEVTGKNVGTPGGNITLQSISTPSIIDGSLTVKNGGVFLINSNSIVGPTGTQVLTVENGGVFKTGDVNGFSGTTSTSVKNDIETINLNVGSTVEYSRSGAQTITNAAVSLPADANYQNLTVSGTGVKTTAEGVVTVKQLTKITAATAELLVPSPTDELTPNVMYALGGINNSNGTTGKFVLANDAQLMQSAAAVNANAAVEAHRNLTLTTGRKEYNYLTSPVKGQEMKSVIGGNADNIQYVMKLNEATNAFVNAGMGSYVPGLAYAVKEPKLGVTDNVVNFKGEPFNSDVDFDLYKTSVGRGYNLAGNPYPSNLDLDSLYLASTNVDSTFRFWDNKVNNIYTQYGGSYQGYSYALYNAPGGTGIPAPGGNGMAATGKAPNHILKIGQGFMIRVLPSAPVVASGKAATLSFKNSQRMVDQTDAQFFGKERASVPKDRYWLEYVTPANLVMSNAFVYFSGGNNLFSADDTRLSSASDALYSLIEDVKVVINGRSPFTSADVIRLGMKGFAAGNYKIRLGNKEGIFADGQSIYLKDKQLGIYTDLTAAEYVFTSNSGEFTDRFEVVYEPGIVLGTVSSTHSALEVYRDGFDFVIHSSDKTIETLELYDASGRLLFTKKTNAKEIRVNADHLAEGIYILKAQLKEGGMLAKKIRK